MIVIPGELDNRYSFSSVSCDIDEDYDEIYECGFDVTNTECPKRNDDDYRAIVIELVHSPRTDTWSFEILYNAYVDNWYVSSDNTNCGGDRFKTFEEVAMASFSAYNKNIPFIKKFIEEIDNEIRRIDHD